MTGSITWSGTHYIDGVKEPYSSSQDINFEVVDPPQGGISTNDLGTYTFLDGDCQANLNLTANVKVTLTWTGAGDAPKSTILTHEGSSNWGGSGWDFIASGNASNGLGDPYIEQPPPFYGGYSTTLSAPGLAHFEVVSPTDGKITFTKTLSVSLNASGKFRFIS